MAGAFFYLTKLDIAVMLCYNKGRMDDERLWVEIYRHLKGIAGHLTGILAAIAKYKLTAQ